MLRTVPEKLLPRFAVLARDSVRQQPLANALDAGSACATLCRPSEYVAESQEGVCTLHFGASGQGPNSEEQVRTGRDQERIGLAHLLPLKDQPVPGLFQVQAQIALIRCDVREISGECRFRLQ